MGPVGFVRFGQDRSRTSGQPVERSAKGPRRSVGRFGNVDACNVEEVVAVVFVESLSRIVSWRMHLVSWCESLSQWAPGPTAPVR
jgi:hypothetical protein